MTHVELPLRHYRLYPAVSPLAEAERVAAIDLAETALLLVDVYHAAETPAAKELVHSRWDREFWLIVEDVGLTRLEWTLRHAPSKSVVLVTQCQDLDRLAVQIRRHIHYRYTSGRLTLLNFTDPVEAWLDPDAVELPEGILQVFEF